MKHLFIEPDDLSRPIEWCASRRQNTRRNRRAAWRVYWRRHLDQTIREFEDRFGREALLNHIAWLRILEMRNRPCNVRRMLRDSSAFHGISLRKLSKAWSDSFYPSRTADDVDNLIDEILEAERQAA